MNKVAAVARHSAPGQYLGYALQPVRLCFHLMSAVDGAGVSMEHLDDVAIHLPNGEIVLEQCKSALSQNPLSDWSEDLWKTLANWLEFMAAGDIDPAVTTYRLYVTPVKSGGFSTALHDARTDADVASFVTTLKTKLGKLKSLPASGTHIQRFLDANPDHRAALIKNLTIVSIDADPLEPLRAIYRLLVPPAILDIICERAIGAAKESADRLLRSKQVAKIDASRFRAEQQAFVQKNNLPGLLISFADAPSDEEVQQLMGHRPTFVRQLELVQLGSDMQVRAVSDFLRTTADISKWGDAGIIFEKDLENWDNDLVRRHGHIAGEIHTLHSAHPSEARGQMVYHRCALLEPPMDGRAVPGHFVHGSYNSLADRLRLGWHPDYVTLLRTLP